LSEEEGGESEEDEQAPIIKQKANKGWPSTCRYTPAPSGQRVIKLKEQPSDLRSIIRVAIDKVTSDALHETAYRAVDSLVSYYRYILWSSARSLNLSSYAKRFEKDHEFGKVISRVVRAVSFVTKARSLTIVPRVQSSMAVFQSTVDK
jgi:hypothetical protein